MNSNKKSNMTRSRKRTNNKSSPSKNDGNRAEPYSSTRLPFYKGLQLVVPDKMFTKLTWNGAQQLTINTSFSNVSYRYRPTAAYDIDPALGSTSAPGFSELSALYGSYRVPRSRIIVEAVNSDARPSTLVVLPLNSDPGNSSSLATVASWKGNPYSKYEIVPGAGSPKTRIEISMSTEKIFGSKAVYFDDNFAAVVTGIPQNNWFWAIGVLTAATVTGSAQVITALVKVEIDIEFFNRVELLS